MYFLIARKALLLQTVVPRRHFTVHGLWCLFYLNALSGNTNTFVDTRQFLIRINTEIW